MPSVPIDDRERSESAPLTVAIAVLTFRREAQLAALLPQLIAQAEGWQRYVAGSRPAGARAEGGQPTPTGTSVRILVVDNDAEQSARVVATQSDNLVRYISEPTPGIAAARARAVSEAVGTDVIVFIDDDEEPAPGWLTELIRTWLAYDRPAGVVGRVSPRFDGTTDPWIDAGGFFKRRRYATGATVPAASSANLLLDIAQLSELGLNFDSRLGLRGGEDTLLTRTLTRTGRTLVWCDEAEVVDHIAPERMNRRWVLRRAYAHAAVTSRLDLGFSGSSARVRLRLVAGGAARAAGGLAMAAGGMVSRRLVGRARGWRLIYRGLGMLSGAIGRDVVEYQRPTSITEN